MQSRSLQSPIFVPANNLLALKALALIGASMFSLTSASANEFAVLQAAAYLRICVELSHQSLR